MSNNNERNMVRLLLALLSIGVTVYFIMGSNKALDDTADVSYDRAYEQAEKVEEMMQQRTDDLQKDLDKRLNNQ